jgi:hypothetical protein
MALFLHIVFLFYRVKYFFAYTYKNIILIVITQLYCFILKEMLEVYNLYNSFRATIGKFFRLYREYIIYKNAMLFRNTQKYFAQTTNNILSLKTLS